LASARLLGCGGIACIQGTNTFFGFCNLAWKSYECSVLTELLAFKEQIPIKHFNHLQRFISSCFQAYFCSSTLHKRISHTQDIIYAPDIFTAKVRYNPNTALFLHEGLETTHLLGSEPSAWQAHKCLVSARKIGTIRFCSALKPLEPFGGSELTKESWHPNRRRTLRSGAKEN
jgi:hypothetical protein